MFDFAYSSQFAPILRDDVIWDGQPCPDLARSAVARKAFMTRDSEWYLIALIDGEFDALADLTTEAQVVQHLGLAGGETIHEPGYYSSPAHPHSRKYYSAGETAPVIDSHYGQTFWKRDSNQK